MISHLRGSVHRLGQSEVDIDIQGVGYRVTVPADAWEALEEGQPALLWISTYVREDRLELFGFRDISGRVLFEELTKIPGIGPRTGLELCGVPRPMLLQAVTQEDAKFLSNIRGIGKKTAEKLLVELRSLLEKKPDLLGTKMDGGDVPAAYDQDAIAALSSLGYEPSRIMEAIKKLPPELRTTEERVAAALRSL